MAVIALDLATTTGWAVHSPGMNRPHSGHIRFSTDPGVLGKQLAKLEAFLDERHKMYKFDTVVFEAQHVPHPKRRPDGKASAGMNPDTMKRLFSLGGVAEMWAYKNGCECWDVEIASWRKHFIGRGSGFAKANVDPKQMALQKCEAIGWHVGNADEAEALGILDYFLQLDPKFVAPWRDNAMFNPSLRQTGQGELL